MFPEQHAKRSRLAKQKKPWLGFALGCLGVLLILFAIFAAYVITRPRGYFDEQDIETCQRLPPHPAHRHDAGCRRAGGDCLDGTGADVACPLQTPLRIPNRCRTPLTSLPPAFLFAVE